jgi:hypothetical protein
MAATHAAHAELRERNCSLSQRNRNLQIGFQNEVKQRSRGYAVVPLSIDADEPRKSIK